MEFYRGRTTNERKREKKSNDTPYQHNISTSRRTDFAKFQWQIIQIVNVFFRVCAVMFNNRTSFDSIFYRSPFELIFVWVSVFFYSSFHFVSSIVCAEMPVSTFTRRTTNCYTPSRKMYFSTLLPPERSVLKLLCAVCRRYSIWNWILLKPPVESLQHL